MGLLRIDCSLSAAPQLHVPTLVTPLTPRPTSRVAALPQAQADADPAGTCKHEVDAEEQAEHVETRNRPMRRDHDPEDERDQPGHHHPDPGHSLLHAETEDDPHNAGDDQ